MGRLRKSVVWLRRRAEQAERRSQVSAHSGLEQCGRLVTLQNVQFGGNNRVDDFCELRNVEVGYASTFSRGCVVRGPVAVGRYTQCGPGVGIFGKNHPTRTVSSYVGDALFGGRRKTLRPVNPVEIGNDVWVGAGAVMVAGCSIGDGAVVAAKAVVVDDVPAYGIAAGVPARIVGHRFGVEVIAALQRLAWWEWSAEALQEVEDFFEADLRADVNRSLRLIADCRERLRNRET